MWDAQLYEGPLARAGRFLTSSDMRMQSWVAATEDPASAARQKQQAPWQKQALVSRDSAASTSHVRHAHCMRLKIDACRTHKPHARPCECDVCRGVSAGLQIMQDLVCVSCMWDSH